jgi:hypothetical protein
VGRTWPNASLYRTTIGISQTSTNKDHNSRIQATLRAYSFCEVTPFTGMVDFCANLSLHSAGVQYLIQVIVLSNVKDHRTPQITEPPKICQAINYYSTSIMSQQRNTLSLEHEGRLQLALLAFNSGQFRSHRAAAKAFDVKRRTLDERARGVPFCLGTVPNTCKLTLTEEQIIVRYILDLDSQGFAPRLCEVADMADKVLGVRGGEPVGKKWAARFITRSNALKIAFN